MQLSTASLRPKSKLFLEYFAKIICHSTTFCLQNDAISTTSQLVEKQNTANQSNIGTLHVKQLRIQKNVKFLGVPEATLIACARSYRAFDYVDSKAACSQVDLSRTILVALMRIETKIKCKDQSTPSFYLLRQIEECWFIHLTVIRFNGCSTHVDP